jgi:uncharacterized protein (DUF433 family)
VSGAPVIRGSRVPAQQVIDNFDAGESVEDIAYNFDLRSEDIKALLQFVGNRQPAHRS